MYSHNSSKVYRSHQAEEAEEAEEVAEVDEAEEAEESDDPDDSAEQGLFSFTYSIALLYTSLNSSNSSSRQKSNME